MKRTSIISITLLVLYAAFFLWYTSLRGPLDAEEIDHYVALLAEGGVDQEGLMRIRRFLEEDTGDDFAMLNVIELNEPPLQVEGVEPSDSASDVLARYMEFMWPALLKRACHPVLFGSASAPALDTWGLEGAREWSQGAVMRYRSRRDMMEISTDPSFGGRHDFKFAAMAKTVAFPIDPWFQLGDPRLLGGLIVAIALLTLRLLTRGDRPTIRLSERLS